MNHKGNLPGGIFWYLYFWNSRVETGQRDNSFLLCLSILLRLFAFLALVLPKIRVNNDHMHPKITHFLPWNHIFYFLPLFSIFQLLLITGFFFVLMKISILIIYYLFFLLWWNILAFLEHVKEVVVEEVVVADIDTRVRVRCLQLWWKPRQS